MVSLKCGVAEYSLTHKKSDAIHLKSSKSYWYNMALKELIFLCILCTVLVVNKEKIRRQTFSDIKHAITVS